jgi:hypothetical protein
MANIDAALGEQVFDVPQAERVFDRQQHRQADYLGRAVEIAEWACGYAVTRHPAPLPSHPYQMVHLL